MKVGRFGPTTQPQVELVQLQDRCLRCQPCRGRQLRLHWPCIPLDIQYLLILLNVVKLDWMDINVVSKALVKDVVLLGANLCRQWQCIHLESLVANLLDLMVEQVFPTVVFMLVDFVGAWDLRRTHKGMRLAYMVVVNSLVTGMPRALWRLLEVVAHRELPR